MKEKEFLDIKIKTKFWQFFLLVFVFWIFGEEHFSVFVRPEAVQIGQNIYNGFTLARI